MASGPEISSTGHRLSSRTDDRSVIDPVHAPEAMIDDRQALKRAAAEWAAGLVCSGMVVGLGTGSTTIFALRRIAARLSDGSLSDVVAIPTSSEVEATARSLGIPLGDLDAHPVIDLTIDGADEVDPQLNLIKGGGGALLREKIVAQASRREIIVVDAAKCSERLGLRHCLPVEVVDFGWRPEALHLESLGAKVTRRASADGPAFRTDQHNFILDVDFGAIEDPEALAATLLARAGIVEVGLFCGLVSDLVVGTATGVEHRSAVKSS
jgi:ribose 5-phosphate isomerase A